MPGGEERVLDFNVGVTTTPEIWNHLTKEVSSEIYLPHSPLPLPLSLLSWGILDMVLKTFYLLGTTACNSLKIQAVICSHISLDRLIYVKFTKQCLAFRN